MEDSPSGLWHLLGKQAGFKAHVGSNPTSSADLNKKINAKN